MKEIEFQCSAYVTLTLKYFYSFYKLCFFTHSLNA
jgi:hypothetical protein